MWPTLQQHGFIVRFAGVFGSWATGKAGPWSDIALLVVSPRFDDRRSRQDVGLLWRLAAQTDSAVSSRSRVGKSNGRTTTPAPSSRSRAGRENG
ncbi:MAG: nucleotidyltransferase domain-containing protein [Nitrospirae bacterium]|nr:nucleotidyltransferase domain-containing protein [Nitrospirota bacterium]